MTQPYENLFKSYFINLNEKFENSVDFHLTILKVYIRN